MEINAFKVSTRGHETKEQIDNAEKELIAHILNRKRLSLVKQLESLSREEVAEPQHLFDASEQQKLNLQVAAEKIKKEQEHIGEELDRIDNLIKNISDILPILLPKLIIFLLLIEMALKSLT